MPGVRTTRAQLILGAGLGGVTELPLPMIEGQIVVPQFVTVTLSVDDAGNDIAAGISFNRSEPVPTTTESPLTNPAVWWWHAFGANASFEADMRDREFELGGPQAFWYFNGVAATRVCTLVMHYVTKQVSLARWSAIAHNTSFED